ncbi:hypothetical protein KSF_104450 [Reticulibacter mediterranei]|uniref:Uncharacterized protein n=1 Tax=Reticulibacter mediterranei TaxID=2778369 RepID=A0A8J3NAI2_9CHLR|nr:type I-C CRISPR-associated protein Cas8c/Csd1 [Reticulibacter mediterranei]GHP00398.1 hypothetical protein KSF_104450 [Reticulibacter mediterranei]
MSQHRGYFLGRLFAFLAQQNVLEQPVEHCYQQACTHPPQVIPQALATMIAAGKEETLFPLMKYLPLSAFDGPLNRREQGAFALGYTHERTGASLPFAEEDLEEDGQELTERYEFRVDPHLKEWIKREGGGPFIRALLRNERVKQVPEILSEPREESSETRL